MSRASKIDELAPVFRLTTQTSRPPQRFETMRQKILLLRRRSWSSTLGGAGITRYRQAELLERAGKDLYDVVTKYQTEGSDARFVVSKEVHVLPPLQQGYLCKLSSVHRNRLK